MSPGIRRPGTRSQEPKFPNAPWSQRAERRRQQQQLQQTQTPEAETEEVPLFVTGSNREPIWTPTGGKGKAKAKPGYPRQGRTPVILKANPKPPPKKVYPQVPIFTKAKAASPAVEQEPLAPTQTKAVPPTPPQGPEEAWASFPEVSEGEQVEPHDGADFNFSEVQEALNEAEDEEADEADSDPDYQPSPSWRLVLQDPSP